MPNRIVEAAKRLQEYILESGLASSILSLPAPRMLSLPTSTSEDSAATGVFTVTVTEKEIVDVSRDLFASGHYSLSVQEAYKAVDKFVSDKISSSLSGTQLMNHVFGSGTPILCWSDRQTQSELDEQKGYHFLFSGAMIGIRNPVTHEFDWVDDPEIALELLVFAQHLLRKARLAKAVA